ncbi:type I secretion protein [Mesorhizobium sp. L-8-10]|uniref:ATP-binding cassette domain-containing protein n=1 Tax=unclassified Mesorhizobium TaxID=325217 RepID=UPI001927209B|nr:MULTISPECIES: ATP-binding cassette domain-containing protein [unclassified Mesorhizobium]BCH23177.1 type I secretion protein [Mesorhizobium sp. L-8-3]BCH30985.1 type I secretion protein [Mesorhizobium sp. L-8-10]
MGERQNQNILRGTFRSVSYILYVAVAFSFLYNLLRLTGPLFILLVHDRVLPSRSEATLVALFLLVVTFLVVMTLLDYSRRRILARFGAQFQERLEDHIFSATARDAYLVGNASKPTSDLNEADNLRSFFHSGSLVAILDFLWSPMFLVTIFLIHWVLGWVVVGGLLLLLAIMIVRTAFAKDRDERFSEARNRIGALKDMLLVSRDVIQSQQMTPAYNENWIRARRKSRDSAIELNDWNAWFSILSTHAAMLMQYSVLAAGAYLILDEQLTMGAMVACMFLSMRVFYPVERFVKQLPRIGEAISDWRKLDKTLKAAKSTGVHHPEVGDASSLSLSGVSVRSPLTRQKILRSVDLKAEPGSFIEIVGNSGSGKTVLAETLLGRMPRAGGEVRVGDARIERLSVDQASEVFAYVPQHVGFVNGTIEENITCLQHAPDREKLFEVARLAQIDQLIRALPNGYGTPIDAAASSFSKSERHQIALARALYRDPKILIVDEPDQTFREGLSNELRGTVESLLGRGGVIILLTRAALKKFQPTRRFRLDDGRLSEVKPAGNDMARTMGNVVKLNEKKAIDGIKISKARDEG